MLQRRCDPVGEYLLILYYALTSTNSLLTVLCVYVLLSPEGEHFGGYNSGRCPGIATGCSLQGRRWVGVYVLIAFNL